MSGADDAWGDSWGDSWGQSWQRLFSTAEEWKRQPVTDRRKRSSARGQPVLADAQTVKPVKPAVRPQAPQRLRSTTGTTADLEDADFWDKIAKRREADRVARDKADKAKEKARDRKIDAAVTDKPAAAGGGAALVPTAPRSVRERLGEVVGADQIEADPEQELLAVIQQLLDQETQIVCQALLDSGELSEEDHQALEAALAPAALPAAA